MAVLKLCLLPEPVLRRKAKRVSAIDASIRRLIRDMTETLEEARGVGLAAPQVGASLRVVVIRLPEEVPFAIVNPEMVKRTGEREVPEGCLSIPGYAGLVRRSEAVLVKGQNEKGQAVRIKATDLLAQALEHELDHLNGILYIDHIEISENFYRVEAKPEEVVAAEAP